ncbi:pilus assembly protein PilM [Microbacterium sp. LRZ72]|uniref:pilus assembly protein PilM n=1 Tax=Microbacterium sp. LRZ72 TaxID=2942481 RepID=UPI0029A0CED7|nr:pilus assembly protein PilM [Microbacterium sp. LRZ72]MDX2377127.1 pilus assembly protein PilM [Microbacterium sp. LRZ72]
MAKTLVGIEITQESVRAVEVTATRGTPRLLASGEVTLPPGAARDSEVLDADAVAVAIRQLWSRAGISGRHVVLAIGGRRVLVREYTTAAMRPDLLRQALPYQVQELLPVPAAQAVLDFYPVSERDGQVSGLLVAAVAETVEALVQTLARAKLVVDAVDLAPFGLARIAARVAAGTTTAMVHVGAHTTHVVIATDGVPRLVRVLPIDVPTQASLGRMDDVDIDAALEQMLETVPPGDAPAFSETASRASSARVRPSAPQGPAGLDPVIGDLADRVRSTLAFFGNRPDATPISRVHVSGAGATAPGLRSALIGALDLPVHEVHLDDVVAIGDDRPTGESALNLVGTAGILLGEVR